MRVLGLEAAPPPFPGGASYAHPARVDGDSIERRFHFTPKLYHIKPKVTSKVRRECLPQRVATRMRFALPRTREPRGRSMQPEGWRRSGWDARRSRGASQALRRKSPQGDATQVFTLRISALLPGLQALFSPIQSAEGPLASPLPPHPQNKQGYEARDRRCRPEISQDRNREAD